MFMDDELESGREADGVENSPVVPPEEDEDDTLLEGIEGDDNG